ncbi:MAG: 1,2-phenylacetyl-CoA epoxidase subunit PaaD [Planctomycetota bacterium]
MTEAVWTALRTVTDPEIPVLTVVDMGIISGVRITESGVAVDVTPTFSACPAVALIREQIVEAVSAACGCEVIVRIVYDPPWTTERMTEEGRRKLKEFGVAPPSKACVGDRINAAVKASTTWSLEHIPCPFCDSKETELESIFGPTLCRSIHYCRGCQQSFEHFKPVE